MIKESKSHLLELLPDGSIYDIIPDLVGATLDHGEFYIAKKGEIIAKEGDIIENFILPIDENIKLTQFDEATKKEKAIGFLQRKRSLALKELLFDLTYEYTAVCETPTRIIKLKRDFFLKILKNNPKIEYYLKLIVQSSGLRSFKLFLEENGLQKNQIIEIFNKIVLQDQKLKTNQSIEFDSKKLYFIRSGELEVNFVNTDTKYRKLSLYEASFFGGEALLPPYRLSYQLKAKEDTIFHFAAINDILPELEKYNIINELHKEPWVTKRAKAKRLNPWKGIQSDLFGEIIDAKELKKLKHLNISSHYETSKSDKHSFYLNILNFAKLIDIQIAPTSIYNQIANIELVSVIHVCNIFESFPVVTQNTKADFNDIKSLETPFLFIYNNRLIIFLKEDGDDSYILDVAVGLVKIKTKEVFSEKVDILTVQNIESKSFPLSYISLFTKPITDTKHYIYFIAVLLAFSFMLGVLQPYFLQLMMDEALLLKDYTTLFTYGIGLVVLLLFSTFSNIMLQFLFREVSIDYDKNLSSFFYKSALNKPNNFFNKNSTGEVLSRFFELENIRNIVSIDTMQALIDALSIMVYSLILFAYGPKLAFLPFIFLVLCFSIQFFYFKRLKKHNSEAFKLVSERNSLVTETLRNITSLKFIRAQNSLKNKWESSLVHFLELKRKIQNENALLNLFLNFGTYSIQIVTVWIAVLLSIEENLSTGAIVAISIYVGKATIPITTLNLFFLKTQRAGLSFEKVGDILEDEVKPRDISTNHYVSLKGKMKLERVYFRYQDQTPWNLNDINITIHPGQCLAIVGPSGCGKTTLAKIISGQLNPSSGRIFYDDYDSEFLSPNCLNSQISLVEQDSDLFSGTFDSNICVNDNLISTDRFNRAIDVSQSEDLLKAINNDFSDQVLSSTRNLSMGQRQKIAIARAIYKSPSCLIMDEMTSALDPFTEKKVFEKIKTNLLGVTQIIISHKKSAIQNADQILVMDQGAIVERGTHEELIEKEGLYSRLFN